MKDEGEKDCTSKTPAPSSLRLSASGSLSTTPNTLPPTPSLFSTRLTIRFGETDPAGLVYYPNLFHYLHIALEEFFAARCGIPYHKLISDQRLGFPTVNVQTEFLVPLVYGDEALIEVYVSRVGVSSATFEYRIKRASDGLLCVRATHVQVAMNLDTRRAVPIPERYRQAFLNSRSS